MDILVSSNVERQLFELTGRNAEAIATWMEELKANKSFTVDAETLSKLQADFKSDSVDSETCLNTIKEVLDKYNYLIDPHTAVAYKVAERLHGENPVLIASTAHWAKFGENVYRALHDIAPDQPLPESVAELSGCALNDLIASEANSHNIPKGLAEARLAAYSIQRCHRRKHLCDRRSRARFPEIDEHVNQNKSPCPTV